MDEYLGAYLVKDGVAVSMAYTRRKQELRDGYQRRLRALAEEAEMMHTRQDRPDPEDTYIIKELHTLHESESVKQDYEHMAGVLNVSVEVATSAVDRAKSRTSQNCRLYRKHDSCHGENTLGTFLCACYCHPWNQ